MSLEIPQLRALARHALPNVVEATLVPLALFYAAMWSIGIWGALGAALVWSYTAIGFRLVTRRRVPGILVLGALGMTARTVIALASQSVFIYFLQPSLGTVAVAGTFLLSVYYRRPLAEKLARDFCPLPESFVSNPHVRAFFGRISLLWGFVFLANAAATIWLLLSQSVGVYLIAKTGVSAGLTTSAIVFSTWWFMRTMRAQGIPVVRASRVVPSVAPVPAVAPQPA